MNIAFPLSGWLFVFSSAFLGYFAFTIYEKYKENPTNKINVYFYRATSFVAMAMFFYGAPSIVFGNNYSALIIGGEIATIFALIGYSNFLMIPMYSWLKYNDLFVFGYVLALYGTLVVALNITFVQKSYIDVFGIIHWQFNPLVSFLISFLMIPAFGMNVFLVAKEFQKLRKWSFLNSMAIMVTFLLALFGGGYQYVGDNTPLLVLSAIFLYIGMFIVFMSAVVGAKK